MSNIDRAAEIIYQKTGDHYLVAPIAKALEDAGLLATDPQIISTVEELRELDPEAMVQRHPQHPGQYPRPETDSDLAYVVQRWGTDRYLPAVLVAPGEQVRAARQALKEATE